MSTKTRKVSLVMEGHKLNIVFLPYFTTSHMLPMAELARQLSLRGATSTIITTPSNAALFQSFIDHDTASGNHISTRTLDFPSSEVGLAPGIENYSKVTSPKMIGQLGWGIHMLQKPMEQLICELSPDAIVSDMFFPWTVDTAEQLNIPRLMFCPNTVFVSCITNNLRLQAPHKKALSEAGNQEMIKFLISDLPDKIEMTTSQLQNYYISETEFGKLTEMIEASKLRSHGIVFDSFHELAPSYSNHFKKSTGFKFWQVGPLSHFPNLKLPKNNQTTNTSIEKWLDNQKPKSVVYICFGTMAMFPQEQLVEIALALEASDTPFIWVVHKHEDDNKKWLPDGYEERLEKSKKGLIIRNWAPQFLILNHESVGGYVTHCGWNSVVESMIAGVPLITWPLFAEQFFNEKLITCVLKIGIEVGSNFHNSDFRITSPVVGKENIEKALSLLMVSSEETEEMRRRAKELGNMALKAVEEDGSSCNHLRAMFDEILAYRNLSR